MRKKRTTLGMWLLTLVLVSALAVPAAGASPGAANSISRDQDPVIVRGSDLPLLAGTAVDDVFVYVYQGGTWSQIPFQVDEVDASGAYVSNEDGLLDGNDEVVFMAKDLGGQTTGAPSSSGGQPLASIWYTIEVSDPLVAGAKGWAYVLASASLNPSFAGDYVSFDPGLHRLNGTTYHLGFATPKLWADYLTLGSSGTDILDRVPKLRVCRSSICINENDLPDQSDNLIKDGPVRAILQNGLVLAYGSLAVLGNDLEIPPQFIPNSVRYSMDFSPSASGATYYNAAVPAGVTVDGTPDNVPATPVSLWWQLSTGAGTIVQASDLSGLGGTQSNYYVDNQANDPSDTGDNRHYGDNGISVTNPNPNFSFLLNFYFLSGSQGNLGAGYLDRLQHPLAVASQLQVLRQGQPVFLPTVLAH